MNLVTIGNNAKTAKSDVAEAGYLTGIMYLAPSDLAGTTVCPFAELAGCKEACLNTAGRSAFSNVQEARIRKTRWYHDDRDGFMAKLVKDIAACERKANREGKSAAIRLNGTSDIQWEHQPCVRDGVEYANVMEAFPEIQFYDYTKIPTRKGLPSNYRLLFSYSRASDKYAKLADNLAKNRPDINVAVVFRDELPSEYLGRKVIDGDKDDLRFLDPENVVVGLKAKGKAKRDKSGFVQDVA